MRHLLQNLILIAILSACGAPVQPAATLVSQAAIPSRTLAAARTSSVPAATQPVIATSAAILEAAATRLPATQPVQPVPGATEALVSEGKLAFVRDGSIWAMDLPDGRPRQITRSGNDHQPRWSPSGRWLAYAYGSLLWVVRDDGSQAHAVDSCPYAQHSHLWAPAVDEILCFTAGGLAIVQADGSGRREVVARTDAGQGGGVGEVAWSPDGKALAYDRLSIITSGTPPERVSSLWRVNVDGSGAMELANAGVPSRDGIIVAGWSPDGSHVLYRIDDYFSGSFLADGTTLWSVAAIGGTAVQVGRNLVSAARPSTDRVLYHDDFIAWPPGKSATGNELAVTFGGYRGSWTNKRVGLADTATGQVTLLSSANMAAISPSWSPDGRALVFSAMPDTGDLVGGETARQGLMQRRIYVVDVEGRTQPRQLTGDPNYRDELPVWSADGKDIFFVRLDQQARPSLWLVPAGGGEARLLVDDIDPVPSPAPPPNWFGYYGHMDWQHLLAWWRGSANGGASTAGAAALDPQALQALRSYQPAGDAAPIVEQLLSAIGRYLADSGDPSALAAILTANQPAGQGAVAVEMVDLTGDGQADVVVRIPTMGLPVMAFVRQEPQARGYAAYALPADFAESIRTDFPVEAMGDGPSQLPGLLIGDLTGDGVPELVVTTAEKDGQRLRVSLRQPAMPEDQSSPGIVSTLAVDGGRWQVAAPAPASEWPTVGEFPPGRQ